MWFPKATKAVTGEQINRQTWKQWDGESDKKRVLR